MSFWSKLVGKGGRASTRGAPAAGGATGPDAPGATEGRPDGAPSDVEPLSDPRSLRAAPHADVVALLTSLTARPLDEDDSLARFQSLRSTAHEARAIEELLARDATSPLPERLAVAVARALIERGEAPSARRLLDHAASPEGLLVAADLRAETGDLPTAIALIERLLLRSFDHPGGRERHRRWRAALGLDVEQRRPDPVGSTVVTSEPDGPYVLLREVARGGAGAVYEAEDRDLLRRAALKVYHEPERDRAQLIHEARTAAALAGVGVVRVFDVDPDHGWLALEWAGMGALRDRLRARDLATLVPLERWVTPLATTLARIHAAGWVHLDVKPANVLFSAEGRPVLTDFGIARRTGEPNAPGSFGYVSPERLAGRAADPRDDVYGFGRILEDVLHMVGDATTTERFRGIVQACVAKDAARLPSAQEIMVRLRTELV